MTAVNTMLAQAKAAAEKLKNQAEESAGDFERIIAAKGPCFARFISYVELGSQPPRGNDKFGKGPKPTAVLEFQLLGKKHAREIEVDGVKKIVYPIVREYIQLSNSPKSWAHKLFKAMDYGRGNTHFAFMLGDAFKMDILHNEVGEGKDAKTYVNIRDESGWKVFAPVREVTDEEGNIEVVPVKVPDPQGASIRMFLWDAPSIEQWESIFIDGTHTRKVNGKDVEQSNNWLQQSITQAKNFEGSAALVMLAEAGGDLPSGPSTDPDDGLSDGDAAEGAGIDDEGTDTPDDGSADPDAAGGAADDPLAGLDLDDEIPF